VPPCTSLTPYCLMFVPLRSLRVIVLHLELVSLFGFTEWNFSVGLKYGNIYTCRQQRDTSMTYGVGLHHSTDETAKIYGGRKW